MRKKQFYNKSLTHEQRHVYQWTSGLLSDLFQISDLMSQLSALSDASESGLIDKINTTYTNWLSAQGTAYTNRLNAAEKDAYDISDPLAPQYLYQNCGRYQ